MKKANLFVVAAVAATAFTSCNNAAKETAKQDVINLDNYVDSVDKLKPVYTVANWSEIDNGYQARAIEAEKSAAELEAADKEKVEKSKAKYAALKTTYETKLKEAEAEAKMATTNDYRQVLRSKLFGEGKVGADMKFDFVTADNILSVYQNFVNTVADHKNDYSREDWDEIKVLYEALDTRKNTVEKDLKGGDNLKIAGLKIKFASIKATHRGGTKGEENQAAKDKQ